MSSSSDWVVLKWTSAADWLLLFSSGGEAGIGGAEESFKDYVVRVPKAMMNTLFWILFMFKYNIYYNSVITIN